jgi:hypothetical protein
VPALPGKEGRGGRGPEVEGQIKKEVGISFFGGEKMGGGVFPDQ